MPSIHPFLWFDSQAEDAAKLYTSLFPNSKIITMARYSGPGASVSGQKEGSVMTVEFSLDGQHFTALNGGPVFHFNESISFVINCDTQEEIDHYWNGLTADGGQESQCGWCKDKFGISWQVVPSALGELMSDPQKAGRVMGAMLQMKKMDIAALQAAAK